MLCLAALGGCSQLQAPVSASIAASELVFVEPKLTERTEIDQSLLSLPPPAKTIPVALYDFQDLSPHIKENDRPAGYAANVSSNGQTMLTNALKDAGNEAWFSVDEHAHISLEGGIIANDYSVVNGGVGAQLLELGGAPYQQNVVTVYLHAFDSYTHRMLVSVTSSETMYYSYLNTSLFKYASPDRPLHPEVGFSKSDPTQLALHQAMQNAVYSLIINGTTAKLWAFKDPSAGSRILAQYSQEHAAREAALVPAGSNKASMAALSAEQAAALSPSAGGTKPGPLTAIGHEYDPGASQIRDMENRRAIRENKYESIGMQRSIPSDY